MVQIAVIGAGVNGIGCALRILEQYPHFKVTVIARDLTPNTTGDGSAGLWGPYLSENTPAEKILQWGKETHDFFHSLWLEGAGGVCLLPVLRLQTTGEAYKKPLWAKAVYGLRTLSDKQIEFWSREHSLKYTCGISFVSYTCEPTILLPYLMKKFFEAGGKVITREIESLGEVASQDHDIIINCSGIGARYLVPDEKVIPIRGQVSRVIAPWVYHAILDESKDGHYIIPNINEVVLGGTSQKNDFNTKVDPRDSKFIHDGCEIMVAGLKNAPLVKEWAGLRPGRESVRVEREDIHVPNERRRKIVIHNYGHGGCGVTLFWGCAKEVVEILQDVLNDIGVKVSSRPLSHL